MVRTDLIPKQRQETHFSRQAGAFAVSCVFHATFFGLLLWVTLVYRVKWMPLPSGSQASAPSITLSTLVIKPPRPSLPPCPPPKPELPVVATTPADVILQAPQPKLVPAENGVPVLTAQPSKTVVVTQTKTLPTHATSAPATRVTKASPTKPKPATSTSFASSYAPGENVLPHPPYPEDAQNLGETGTVVMSVTFNTIGDVTQAEVSQSSGVRLLDTSTRLFILTHWHSTTFAGETVMQPVRYTGE
ncbi:MAG: TonB family protein [Methylacidiphilales bacterium]|nr:TonB family protein [Candidatus Methylacidiphilales bacterium]